MGPPQENPNRAPSKPRCAPSFNPHGGRRHHRLCPHMDDRRGVGIEAPPARLPVERGDGPAVGREDCPGDAVALERGLDGFAVATLELVIEAQHRIAIELHAGVDEGPQVHEDEIAAERIAVEHGLPPEFGRNRA